MKASRETIKMKTSEGIVKVADLGDSPGAEEYLQHLNTFLQMLVRKQLADDLTKCTKAVVSAAASVRKYSKVPNGEKGPEKVKRLNLIEPAKQELVTAEVAETAKVAIVYELFRKGLNRLTAMVAYLRPLFFELRTSLITFRIFVRCQRLIARKLAELFSFLAVACHIDDVSRGSLSGLKSYYFC
jgi:hypothetical protein